MSRKIIIDGKEPSSEQIRKEADFEQVLQASQATVKSKTNILKWIGSAAAVIIILSAGFWFLNSDADKTSSEQSQINNETELITINKANVDLPSESFVVSPNQATDIITKNGAIISIPENAFFLTDRLGVLDSVEIVFTEYSNPLAVHISGINMAYDSADTKYAFQSGGMMELRAYSKGNELTLNDHEKIDISYPALIPDENLNQYSYNEQDRTWNYLGAAPVKSFEVECERKMIRFDNKEKAFNPSTRATINNELKNLSSELDKLVSEKSKEPRKANKENYRFSFDIDTKEFPKLAGMKTVEFEVIDPRFNFSYFDKEWEDVKLKKIKNDKYLVQLFEGKKKKEFVVYPVLDEDEFDLAYSKYQDECSAIKNTEDKLKAKQEVYDSWTEENAQNEIAKANKRKTKGLINSFLSTIESGSLYRSITVDLGIYNFDKPIALPPAGTGVNADFILVKNGEEEELKHVTLVNLDKNIYYPYFKSEMTDFRYQKKFRNIVIATSIEGKVLISQEDEFASIFKNSSKHTFYMEALEEGITNFEELKN